MATSSIELTGVRRADPPVIPAKAGNPVLNQSDLSP